MLLGSLVALVTPMHEDGSLDLPGLQGLIDWHVASGTSAVVVVGTTGESPTVDVEEHSTLIESAVRFAAGRIPVVAGTGANSTREAIELSRFAGKVGANYTLSVVPYYNKPTQEGLYCHFRAVAEAVDIPMILYNVPGRTVADMSNDTALRLSTIPNVVGIKDATGDMARACDLFMRAPEGFACYTGDDATAAAFMLMGGHGVISVTANVVPEAMARLCKAALRGDVRETRACNDPLQALHRDLFIEANPIPVKWALAEMGRVGLALRLPMTPLSSQHHDKLRLAMHQAGLLQGL